MTASSTVGPPPHGAAVRAERLRSSRDVRATFAARRATGSAIAVVHLRERGDAAPPRLTVVAGKAVGNAVMRNRAKRRLRAAALACPLQAGCDYVVVARTGAVTAPSGELAGALQHQVRAVGRP